MLVDHLDLRVAGLARARAFYDPLLVEMGYSRINADGDSAGYHHPSETGAEPFLWLVAEPGHCVNGTRIAFAASSRDAVDRLASIARRNGAVDFEAPALVAEYGPNYYAAFFADPDGNKLEICCRRPQ